MRTTFLITLLLAAATIKSETRMPATPLMEHSANYEANITKGLKLNGKATRSLSQRDDGTWLYNFNVDTLPATISENSVFKVGTKGIVPISYEYKLAGMLIKDRSQSVNFDQNNDKIIEHYKKNAWELDSNGLVLDRLNYQLMLQMDVAAGKTEMNYAVVHKGEIRAYEFATVGSEVIETKLGERTALLVEKVRDGESKRETKLWFDAKAPFLLLRMVQTESDGERYEINITKENSSR